MKRERMRERKRKMNERERKRELHCFAFCRCQIMSVNDASTSPRWMGPMTQKDGWFTKRTTKKLR